MRKILPLLLLLVGAGPSAPAGSIKGTVVAYKNHTKALPDDTFVYLVDVAHPPKKPPGSGRHYEIKQQGESFVPHALVVPIGSEVAFPNYDTEEHNVFSPTDPPEFWDLGRYNTDHKGRSHTFDDAAEIDIYCDVHDKMWAKVKVVDSAYIVQVKDGAYSFTNVPPGTYKVVAWAPGGGKDGVTSEQLTVTAGATVTASELDLQIRPFSTAHTRKHGESDGTTYH